MKKGTRLIILLLAVICILASCGKTEDPPARTVSFISDGIFDYAIVYSDDDTGHYAMATRIFSSVIVDYELEAPLRYRFDDQKFAKQDKEIVIGDTDRQISKDLKAAIAEKENGNGGVWWAYGYKDGKLGFYANSSEAADLSFDGFFELIMKDGVIECSEDLWIVDGMTATEYETYLKDIEDEIKAEEEAARKEQIALLRERIAAIRQDFGALPDFSAAYGGGVMPATPTVGEHPRIYMTPDDLDRIRENLEHPENISSYRKVRALADLAYTGELDHKFDNYNYTTDSVAKLECLAFMYLMTGDELYGYTAIRAAKRWLQTIQFETPDDGTEMYDFSNRASSAMFVFAEVYDWCYPLLSEQDKEYLVTGVANVLGPIFEVGYPPNLNNGVTGHSVGALVLRDWLSFCIATYDEYPEMYHSMLSKMCEIYVPAPNWYYPSGANFQGTSYGMNKTYLHMISELILYKATGYKMYDVSFEPTVITYLSFITPGITLFTLGDNNPNPNAKAYGNEFYRRLPLFASAYYKNPVIKAWGMELSNNYEQCGWGTRLEITPLSVLIFNDPTLKASDDMLDDLPLINYNGSPTGALMARSAWGDSSAWAAYMHIDESYGANHDHKDAGTFQIYYKGMLALHSSRYDSYGSVIDNGYSKQTISKNGLLIYNPKYAKNDGWIYSGGQTTQSPNNSENATLEDWLKKTTSHQAKELGHAWGYDASGALQYAYISGDITNAYDQDTVDLVKRSMISIATGNADMPMMFIVHDRIISDDASFKKTFLLHMVEEPTVNGNVTVITNKQEGNNGRLTSTTLLPEAYTIEKIGGEGKYFWVNGKDIGGSETYRSGTGWGRIEVSPTEQSLQDSFLHVMYVSDADNNTYVPATLVKADTHEGAISFGKCVMFSREADPIAEEFSFTSNSDGYLAYYVTGLSHGKWTVSLNGARLTDITVDKESGVASFKAEAGDITFTPSFGALRLETVGGEFADGIDEPTIYNFNEELTLPTELTRDYYAFDGWYDNPDYNGKPITALDGTDIGEVRLYARWRQVQANLSFEFNKGSHDGELPTRYDYGKTFTLPTDITLYGSEFAGWYLDESFTGSAITEIGADMRDDITLYAKWEKVFDVLAFELNGGTMAGELRITLPDEEYTLPTDVTRENAIFVGWYLDEAFTQKITKVTPDMGDTTVFAKWHVLIENSPASSHKVYYGAVAGQANLNYGDAISEGKGLLTFVFKADKSNAGNERSGVIRVRNRDLKNEVCILRFTNDTIMTASYKNISDFKNGDIIEIVMDFYADKLYYVVNGELICAENASFNDDIPSYNYGAKDQIIGYLWQYNAGGSYAFDIQVWSGNKTSFGKLELELDNGFIEGGTPTEYNASKDVYLPTPTKLGFDFLGWYADPDLNGEPITKIAKGTSGNLKFYAKWEKLYSVLELYTDGGSLPDDFDPKLVSGKEIILPEPTKPGYIFLGWYLDPELTQRVRSITPDTVVDNINVYAKWQNPYWNKQADVKVSEYYFENGDIGSDMIALGTHSLTLRIDVAALGNESWTTGTIRMRQGLNGGECHFVKFENGKMLTDNGGIALTTENSGDTVDFVFDFENQTVTYYVNGERKAQETYGTIGKDLTYYNFKTSPVVGTPLTRTNLFQLTNAAPRKLAYDSVAIFLADIYAEE